MSPNPVLDVLTVHTSTGLSKYVIYNLQGIVVKTSVADNKIHVSDLAAGVYFLRAEGPGEITIIKFIKQ